MAEKESDKQLPLCGVDYRPHAKKRSDDLWWVEGIEGRFRRVGYGKIEGCVHSFDPTNKWSRLKRVVSLRRATKEEISKIVFGR